MSLFSMTSTAKQLFAICALFVVSSVGTVLHSQQGGTAPKPLILSSQMENGTLVYRLNGKRVEDNKGNSLLTNLERVVAERGTGMAVFVVIDARAPFTEMGKLATALDKVDLNQNRKFFVSYFNDGMMNEIHWDDKSIPIPQN